MTASHLIAHLTDPHLLATRQARLHGWPVATAFEHVWADLCAYAPQLDALILGGDLVDDLSPAGYRWLDAHIAALACPVLAIAGNHDDPAAMAAHLPSAEVHGALEIGGWRLIGLNTQVTGAEHGRLAPREIRRLTDLSAASDCHLLVAMHHPPLAVGTPWIDAIGLQEPEAFSAWLADTDECRGVLAGHVHQDFTGHLMGRPVWTTPSTMRQFLPGAVTFAEDTSRCPGWRWLRLWDDGRLETAVRRVDVNVDGPR